MTAIKRYYPPGSARLKPVALPERGCVYVKNAKAGSSTVLLWLHRIRSGDATAAPVNVHTDAAVTRVSDLGWPAMADRLSSDYVFTVVRDPVARFESAVRSKVLCETNNPARAQIEQTLGLPAGSPLTVEQVLAAVESIEPIMLNAHWRPQHLNLALPLVRYDLIGHLESLASDLARVQHDVALPDAPHEARNATSSANLLADRPDLRRRVEVLFETDLDLFGY